MPHAAADPRFGCMAVAGILGLCVAAPVQAGPPSVDWSGGQLTVHAVNATRQDLLRAVARRTGARIDGVELASGTVTIDLIAVPLGTGLQALAGDLPYALTESAPRRDGAVRVTLQIHAAGSRGAVPAPPNVGTANGQPIRAPSLTELGETPRGRSIPAPSLAKLPGLPPSAPLSRGDAAP